MPFTIRVRDGRYCVVKLSEGTPAVVVETLKCHARAADAGRHLTALRVNVEAKE